MVQVRLFESVTTRFVHSAPPMVTELAPVRLLPEMVMAVPPVVRPPFGVALTGIGTAA